MGAEIATSCTPYGQYAWVLTWIKYIVFGVSVLQSAITNLSRIGLNLTARYSGHALHRALMSPPSLQAVCSSETLIRSTPPFVWQSSCTTPARTPRKPRSTWCLTWTTSRRPTASPSPTPVSLSHGSRFCIFGGVSLENGNK